MSDSAPLAIIGISCLFPKADNLQTYWNNIKNGLDAISPVPEGSHWKIDDYFNSDPKAPDTTYARRGGFLSPTAFNPMEYGIAPKDVEATDTTQLLGLVAAKQALADAGYAEKPFDRSRTSVILGVTGALELVIPLGARLGHPIWRRALKEAGVAEPLAEDVVRRIADSYVGWQENSFPGLLGNVAAGRIANRLDLGGTNCVVDAACASSLAALHLAAMELATGRSDMVITGGLDTFNDIFMYMCFSKTPALSPSGNAKPFDQGCDGTIIGEGLGLVVIKRLADAERDGDRIYAVIKGLGSASDGRGNAIYAPRAEGQKKALERAYAAAATPPETVELVEAHGTGTKVGDTTEIQALTEVYRATGHAGTWAALGSVKSQIGHTKAAAGVAGLIKAAMALREKVLPPTIKVTQPLEEVAPGKSPFYVNTQKRPWLPRAAHLRRAGVSSFGFGGTNFHCVLEEHGTRKDHVSWDGDTEIFAFSSDDLAGLRSQVGSLPADLPWPQLRQQAQASRRCFRAQARYRLLIPLNKGASLGSLRDAARSMLDQHPEKTAWSLPSGIAFGSGERHGKLGALFPGQGSQYVGMLRDLACQFPEMLEALAAANNIFAREHPDAELQRLSDFIYPHPAFNDESRRQQEESLKATEVAQPALGAVGLGALQVLNHFGVAPEAAAGHSYGELLALCGAGRMEPDSLHWLSNLRGRLMGKNGGNGNSDRGAMLAVQAPEQAVSEFVREANLDIVIANRNSPSQFVLAGPKPRIEQAATELAKKSIRTRILSVSAAFHSAMVATACQPFASALEKIPFAIGTIPVYANSTGRAYPQGTQQARELLASQIIRPVDFQSQIETMFADGVTTFVEVGPGHVLSDLVQSILHGRAVETIALDSSRGGRSGVFDLAVALCRLASLGHGIDLTRWEIPVEPASAASASKTGMVINLAGANYRNPQPARTPAAPAIRQDSPLPAKVASQAIPAATPASKQPPAAAAETKAALPADLNSALQTAQQGMLALQQMQEQTARLHHQFLDSQEAARRTLESLLNQRRGLLFPGAIPSAPLPPSASTLPAFAPAVVDTPPSTPPASQASQPQAPEPTPPTSVPSPQGTATAGIIAREVLKVVSDKTGYPAEMLELGMGLDSDLGIDSIKRVEIMAALRSRLPGSPEIKPEHLGTLRTLQEVVDFLSQNQSSAAAPPEPVASTANQEQISQALLKVVAEKTGYPVEMLNLEMGLDSDLGIDSIKRVEIMAAIRTQLPDAPEIKPEHLGTLQTLQQIVDFLGSSGSEKRPVPAAAEAQSGAVERVLLQVVAEKTGYPVEMLNLGMGLDADLGIDSIKRVEIMAAIRTQLPDAPEIKPEHLGTLQTLQQIVDFLTAGPEKEPPATPASLETRKETPAASGNGSVDLHRQIIRPVKLGGNGAFLPAKPAPNTLIWITNDGSSLTSALQSKLLSLGYGVRLGTPAELVKSLPGEVPAGLVILWPSAGSEGAFLKEAFQLLQKAGPSLRNRNGHGPGILATVSRLDGLFGFGSLNGKSDAISGGLAGLVKTARHEWPEVQCKAIDLDPEVETSPDLANRILEEIFRKDPVEVGISRDARYGLQTELVPFNGNGVAPLLKTNDVVVVTGGARGITASVAIRLASQQPLRMVLLGRSLLAENEPEWLAGLTLEADLKKALLAKANGHNSPKQIEAKYREIIAQREIRDHLRQIRRFGAEAIYRPVDIRNNAEVAQVLAEVRQAWGPIQGLIHGAGVLADRRIEDKTEEQFDLVYHTKVSGLQNLLAGVAADDLKLLALFSSYTGRFGRIGQVDYAAANEVLNKIAQVESRRRPNCRVVSFNWGPWNGGMVTDGLKKVFEDEGVGLIEPDAGARFFVREISEPGSSPVEVLALAPAPKRNGHGSGDNGSLKLLAGSVAFERAASVKALPCLASHVLQGRAVLPAALMMEWLAQGAAHNNPGLVFQGLEQFQVLKGLVLDPAAETTVQVLAEPAQMRDGCLRVTVQLASHSGSRPTLHARAEVRLAENPLANPPAKPSAAPAARNTEAFVYRPDQLFHGPHFQGIEILEHASAREIIAQVKSSPSPKQWMLQPLRPAWMANPMAIDCAFQMMILWSWEHLRAACLPCAVRHYEQYSATFPKKGSRVAIEILSSESPLMVANIRLLDRQDNLLARADGCEFVADPALRDAFRLNRLQD